MSDLLGTKSGLYAHRLKTLTASLTVLCCSIVPQLEWQTNRVYMLLNPLVHLLPNISWILRPIVPEDLSPSVLRGFT